MTESTGGDLPPAPTPDTWSAAEAADWDPSEETQDRSTDEETPPAPR